MFGNGWVKGYDAILTDTTTVQRISLSSLPTAEGVVEVYVPMWGG